MFTKTKVILISFLFLSTLAMAGGCIKSKPPAYKFDLEIWGAFDNSSAFDPIFNAYQELNPHVSINYRKFTYDSYKKDLIESMAAGKGPDIFLINNNWIDYFEDKAEPAPDMFIREIDVRKNFADVVASDFVRDGKVYGVPLSVDSMALYYNKDILESKGYTRPPETWEEVVEYSNKIKDIDQFGNIKMAGIALGGNNESVNRGSDILEVMMVQKGLDFWKEKINLNESASLNKGGELNPGQAATTFYTQFSNIGSPNYTWNEVMHYSIDSFVESKVAMMINYSWQIEAIQSKNSKLNFAVAPLPQFAGSTQSSNLADYYTFVVAKNKGFGMAANQNTARIKEAWQLLKFMTFKNPGSIVLYNVVAGTSKEFPVNIDPAREYLTLTGKPAARLDLIEEQKDFQWYSPFVLGNLVSKNWSQNDPEAVDKIISESITSITRGESNLRNALDVASTRINQVK